MDVMVTDGFEERWIPEHEVRDWQEIGWSVDFVQTRRVAEARHHKAICLKTGRSAAVCDTPDHSNCPDLKAAHDGYVRHDQTFEQMLRDLKG